MAEKLLEVKNLRTEFKRDKTWVTAVNNVSFSIQPVSYTHLTLPTT